MAQTLGVQVLSDRYSPANCFGTMLPPFLWRNEPDFTAPGCRLTAHRRETELRPLFIGPSLSRTHAHNKKITTARFPSQLEGKITRFPQQISPNECFIIRVKHGRGRTWLLRPLSPGLINHAITKTSLDWRGSARIQFFFFSPFFPPFVEISSGKVKWANPLGGRLCHFLQRQEERVWREASAARAGSLRRRSHVTHAWRSHGIRRHLGLLLGCKRRHEVVKSWRSVHWACGLRGAQRNQVFMRLSGGRTWER